MNDVDLITGNENFVILDPPILFSPAAERVIVPEGSAVYLRTSVSPSAWEIDYHFQMVQENDVFLFRGPLPEGEYMEYKFFVIPPEGDSFWVPAGGAETNKKNNVVGINPPSLALMRRHETGLDLAHEALRSVREDMSDSVRTALVIRADRILPLLDDSIGRIRGGLGFTIEKMIAFQRAVDDFRDDKVDLVWGHPIEIIEDILYTLQDSLLVIPDDNDCMTLKSQVERRIEDILNIYNAAICRDRTGITKDWVAKQNGYIFPEGMFARIGGAKRLGDRDNSERDRAYYLEYWKPLVEWLGAIEPLENIPTQVELAVQRSHAIQKDYKGYLDHENCRELADLMYWVLEFGLFKAIDTSRLINLRTVNMEAFDYEDKFIRENIAQHINDIEQLCALLKKTIRLGVAVLEFELECHRRAYNAVLAAIGGEENP